jgi:hypothetical protein
LGDVLIVAGGLMACGAATRQLAAGELQPDLLARLVSRYGDEALPGCRLEPLLRRVCPDLPPVQGLVDPQVARRYWTAAQDQGLRGALRALDGGPLPERLLERLQAVRPGPSPERREGQAPPLRTDPSPELREGNGA